MLSTAHALPPRLSVIMPVVLSPLKRSSAKGSNPVPVAKDQPPPVNGVPLDATPGMSVFPMSAEHAFAVTDGTLHVQKVPDDGVHDPPEMP